MVNASAPHRTQESCVKVAYLEVFLKCKIAIRFAPLARKNLSVTGLELLAEDLLAQANVSVTSYILGINVKNVLMKLTRTLIAPVIT